jgi:hypothetical protein
MKHLSFQSVCYATLRSLSLICALLLCLLNVTPVFSQKIKLNTFRPAFDFSKIEYIDLDGDGNPDILRTMINDSVPVQWIDDSNTMQHGDLMGDLANGCLMIDRNGDGIYGGEMDLIIDWIDKNGDGRADVQMVVDNASYSDKGWTPGHFMITLDTDNDQIFNYINWNTLQLEAWDRYGQCRFHQDYSGKSILLKIHTSVFNLEDPRYNWENPFLFYDFDDDGLSEMAIRFADEPVINLDNEYSVSLSKKITDVRMSFDLDNDNASGNEFDFDMSLRLNGEGFDYSHHAYSLGNRQRFEAADMYFEDTRWREMTELIFVDHEAAYEEIFKGEWQQCWFVFDEDDDCKRWERVEFYEPRDVFAIGAGKGGLDHHPQADATGDRGEWDSDFSGRGNLYISPLDGKIHLLGAEWGAWRIDLHAKYYQGWQGWRGGADTIPHDPCILEPEVFSTIKYSDTNNSGFFDTFEFDMDGDNQFEITLKAADLGIDDSGLIYRTAEMEYPDFTKMFEKSADVTWQRAQNALKAAENNGLSTLWYSNFFHPATTWEKYHNGFWLATFIYLDFKELALSQKNNELLSKIDKAYLTGLWDL